MTQTVYGTKITPYFAARIAALVAQVPSPPPLIDFTQGMLVVGDGNGVVPTVDAIIGNGGVLNQVWTGQSIEGVAIDPLNPKQIDIHCVIPSTTQAGDEIGPFVVREFAIYEVVNGQAQLCIVGTTQLEKTTSGQGQTSDLTWIAAVAVDSTQPIIMTDPSAFFATLGNVRDAWNARPPTAEEPIYIETTIDGTGWKRFFFRIRRATQALLGVGRAATDAEFAAGQPANDSNFAWPWPTLQQIHAALAAIQIPSIPGVVAPITYDGGANKYGAALASADEVRAGASNVKVVTPMALAGSAGLLVLPDNAGGIAWNWAQGYNAETVPAASRTILQPTGAFEGETGTLRVGQAYELSWASCFDFGDLGPPSNLGTAGSFALYSIQCVRAAAAGVTPIFVVTQVATGLRARA